MEGKKHYLAAVTAFVVWGFFSIPLRALAGYSAGEILYFRILFSLAVLIIVVAGFRRSAFLQSVSFLKSLAAREARTVVLLTLAGGALLCVNWLTFIYIVNNINIKTASFSYLICPVITAVLGYFLIHEKMTRMQWIAVALCTLSCLMIGMSSAVELGYSLLTAFTYALYLITQRKNQGFDRLVVLGVQVLFSFVILSFLFDILVADVPVTSDFYLLIFAIATVFTVFPLFLNLYALNRINAATIGILMYLNPIINFSIAFIVFDETPTSFQIGGYILIILALVLFNLHHAKRLRVAVSQ